MCKICKSPILLSQRQRYRGFFCTAHSKERGEGVFSQNNVPNEGELYLKLKVAGHDFELRYGYYEERDRSHCPPVVIWPDLSDGSKRDRDGYPLVTQIQDPCPYYTPTGADRDQWCGDCVYYTGEHREIGICRCEARKDLTQCGGKVDEE